VHMAPPCTRRLLFATWSGQFAPNRRPLPLDQTHPVLWQPRPLLPQHPRPPPSPPLDAAPVTGAAPAPGRGPRRRCCRCRRPRTRTRTRPRPRLCNRRHRRHRPRSRPRNRSPRRRRLRPWLRLPPLAPPPPLAASSRAHWSGVSTGLVKEVSLSVVDEVVYAVRGEDWS